MARRGFALSLAAAAASAAVIVAPVPALASEDHRRVVEVVFPVAGPISMVDTYAADRGGGRRHQGVDIFAPKGTPVYAAGAGRVCWITGVGSPAPAYGHTVSVCSADGLAYHYLHMNNDSPGSDDGDGGIDGAYAPDIRMGARIASGQLLGYLGDSGNAESTPAHLHFEIEDPDLADARITGIGYRPDRLDPYPSLLAALSRGALPRPVALAPGERSPAVAAWQWQLGQVGASALPTTGFYGPQTTAATRSFQQSRGIEADGVAGPATVAALQSVRRSHVGPLQPAPAGPGGSPAPGQDESDGDDGDDGDGGDEVGERHLRLASPPQRGADVESFQARLRSLGYQDPGGQPLAADGIFGPVTAAAAAAFQRSVGFLPGPVGPRTLAALTEVEQARR